MDTTYGRADMDNETRMATLEAEQQAFDEQLHSLLREHEGQFVLFRNQAPVEYFETYDLAFRDGLSRYGTDEPFLIGHVVPHIPDSVSVSWDLGVMFG